MIRERMVEGNCQGDRGLDNQLDVGWVFLVKYTVSRGTMIQLSRREWLQEDSHKFMGSNPQCIRTNNVNGFSEKFF